MRGLAWPLAFGAVAFGLGCGGSAPASPAGGPTPRDAAGAAGAAVASDAGGDASLGEVEAEGGDAPAVEVAAAPEASSDADAGARDAEVPTFDAALVVGCGSAYGPPCPVTYVGSWTILGHDPSSFAAALAPDGSLYLGGSFSGATDLDPTSGTNTRLPAGYPAAYLTKINPAGAYVRSSLFEGTGSWGTEIDSIAPTNTSVVAVGGFNTSIDLDPGVGVSPFDAGANGSAAFIVSLTSDGAFRWGQTLASSDQGFAYWTNVAVSSSGVVYAGGSFNVVTAGAVDLDPGPGTHPAPAGNGTFLAALDATTGAFSWLRVLGGDGCQSAMVSAVALPVDGWPWMLGSYQGACVFDQNGPSTIPTGAGEGIFLAHFAAAGHLQNLLSVPSGVSPSGLAIANDGSLYVTGIAFAGETAEAGVVNFDPSGSAAGNQLVPAGGAAFVLKLDVTGAFRWVRLLRPSVFSPVIGVEPGGGALVATSPPDDVSTGMSIDELGANGQLAWHLTTGGGWIIPSVLVSDANGFYVAGTLDQTADLDPSAGVDHFAGPLSFVSRYKF